MYLKGFGVDVMFTTPYNLLNIGFIPVLNSHYFILYKHFCVVIIHFSS
jgi:hypothetical protein